MKWLSFQLMNDMTYINSGCPLDQFACLNNLECIPTKYICDTMYQCSDGSDEKFCPDETLIPSKPGEDPLTPSKPEIEVKPEISTSKPEVEENSTESSKESEEENIAASMNIGLSIVFLYWGIHK